MMSHPQQDWLNDNDPRTLSGRVERVLSVLKETKRRTCGSCDRPICGHLVVMSLSVGYGDSPLCLSCLAEALGREPEEARDSLVAFALSKDCLHQGFVYASVQENLPREKMPSCLFANEALITDVGNTPIDSPRAQVDKFEDSNKPSLRADTQWDAGDLACGDLVLKLRLRMMKMEVGHILELIANDSAAPEDIPAWCRLTGNRLLRESHPQYLILKQSP